MTIDITVYCLQKPDPNKYVLRFGLDKEPNKFEGMTRFSRRISEEHIGYLVNFSIVGPVVYQRSFDKEIIDEIFEDSNAKGLDIPEDLYGKIVIDSILHPGEPVTQLIISPKDSTPINPDTTRLETVLDTYNFIADPEMYTIVRACPHLEVIDPMLTQFFGIAKYSKGNPVYEVWLCSTQLASQKSIQEMVGLAVAIAKENNGFIYEDQSNEFGSPDPEWLHSNGTGLVGLAMRDIEKYGITLREEKVEEAGKPINPIIKNSTNE